MDLATVAWNLCGSEDVRTLGSPVAVHRTGSMVHVIVTCLTGNVRSPEYITGARRHVFENLTC